MMDAPRLSFVKLIFFLGMTAIMTIRFPATVAADLPRLIPMRDFFRNPEEAGHDLSQDGEHIAFMRPWKSRMNIFVQPTAGGEAKQITQVEDRDIAGFSWVNSSRIVFVRDQGGDENYHLYAVDLDGNNEVDLTPFEGTRAQIIDSLPNDPEHMLIGHNRRDKKVFDAYRLNVTTGEAELVVENPGNIMGYVADHDGKLRIATSTDGVNNSLLFRETEEDEFETVLTTNFRQTLSPLFFTYDNRYIYASSNLTRDKDAIVKFDPREAKELEVIYEHPQVDVSGLLRSDRHKKIRGVAFTAAKRAYHFFDDERREMQEFVEGKLPGYQVSFVSFSLDETKYLVRTSSDKTRGAYYFYNHGTKELRKLAEISPWLNENEMADMRPISYQTRDGILINGYLTVPVGVEAKNLPTVVLPHGGPWARDSWGFRPDVQFLANRGYAVLQMNFRGSTGFGRKFWEMSFKRWGREMQNDITDGVEWLVDLGIADPERIGIYGGSYGGYAVLAGLAFTPEIYACGVDYVGVSNLFTLQETIPPYWEPMREMLYEMMGDPEKDKELLTAASPVFHSDKIQSPLLIAQGANDPRVKKAESDQMVEQMSKRGIDVPYLVKENEGHGFHNEENRFEFYRAMEQFLAEHLDGRIGTGDDVLGNLDRASNERNDKSES